MVNARESCTYSPHILIYTKGKVWTSLGDKRAYSMVKNSYVTDCRMWSWPIFSKLTHIRAHSAYFVEVLVLLMPTVKYPWQWYSIFCIYLILNYYHGVKLPFQLPNKIINTLFRQELCCIFVFSMIKACSSGYLIHVYWLDHFTPTPPTLAPGKWNR